MKKKFNCRPNYFMENVTLFPVFVFVKLIFSILQIWQYNGDKKISPYLADRTYLILTH